EGLLGPLARPESGGDSSAVQAAPLTQGSSGESGGEAGGNRGGGSFSSGPGYPVPPAAAPAFQGDLTAARPETTLPLSLPGSAVAVLPVLVLGAARDLTASPAAVVGAVSQPVTATPSLLSPIASSHALGQ